MTSNSRAQHLLHVTQQAGKTIGWAVAVGIILLGVFLSASAQADTFTVNSPSDVVGAAPLNDSICATAYDNINGMLVPNGVCSLRAAIDETNALTGADQIILPPSTYLLTIVAHLVVNGDLTITGAGASSTIIDGNASVLRIDSGALFISSGTVSISGVTIRKGARAGGIIVSQGGGISNIGTLTLVNSTLSGNSARGDGGGILNFGTVSALNSTITDNRADSNLDGLGIGGGVFIDSGTFTFQNTIIAGNHETEFIGGLGQWVLVFGDCAGTLTSNGNNLLQSLDGCTVIGGGVTVAGPQLGPLQDNGGPTQTHAVLAGSPAIDAGNPGGCPDNTGAPLMTDQRGATRHFDGNNDGTARCDIGAVEFGSGVGVPADFDGDGETDIALYRSGTWFILRSSDNGITGVTFGGLAGDILVPADYDGDGKTDMALYRNGTWFILRSSDNGITGLAFGGLTGDLPL